jgi:hypothetical protein
MRSMARGPANKGQVSRNVTMPAPVKGWSSQYSLAEAEPQTAVILDNIFPESDAVRMRRGCTSQATGIGASVDSVFAYTSQTGGNKLFAAKSTAIYDVTTAGAVGAAVVTATTNGKWITEMFATAGGQFLVTVNGADGVRTFDGTTWVDRTSTITGTSGAVNSFSYVTSHQSRLWFVQANSNNLYYLPASSIAGAAALFPITLKMGGKIAAIATWSTAQAYTLADLFVIISDQGEVLVYQGTDPSSTTTWSLKVRFVTAPPMSAKCVLPVGGDILILTELGLLPISQIMEIDAAALSDKAMTKNIRRSYADAVQGARGVSGWCMTSLPQSNMGIVNVPAYGGGPIQQFVLNTVTGAWARFFGWNANCWAYLAGAIYYGDSNGNVFRAEYGGNDNGAPISAYMLPAFSHLSARGRLKNVSMVRPIVFSDTTLNFLVGVAADYNIPTVNPVANHGSQNWFTWDVTPWDGPAIWRGSVYEIQWEGSANIGTVISPAFASTFDAGSGNNFTFRIVSFDVVYEVGSVL